QPISQVVKSPVEGPARILLVEDNPDSREVLRRLLELQGHQVAEAANGIEALAALQADAFDIVLLDLLMPGMTGLEVLHHLQPGGRLRQTAVIVISALDEIHTVSRCIEAGVEDYLTKPIDHILLRARIASCLEKRRLRVRELE